MKVFLVFIGLFIANVTFIAYEGDMSRYMELQNMLKTLAEDCAAGAALYYDEAAYGEGNMVFNQDEAVEFVETRVEQAKALLQLSPTEALTYQMIVVDKQYPDPEDPGGAPSITVTLQLDTEDLFRLSFLTVKQVVRSAKYELADGRNQW